MQAVVAERIITESWRLASRVPAHAKTLVAGQYQLIQEVGHGAMGVAWLARDLYADRKVCLKLLPQEMEIRDSDVQQMKTTFRLTHRLQHQFLCPHLQFAIDPQIGPFLVMKYYSGFSLTKLCQLEAGRRRIFSMSDDINEVLQRGRAKDPLDRFRSCRVFVGALRTALNGNYINGGLRVMNMDDTIIFSEGAIPVEHS